MLTDQHPLHRLLEKGEQASEEESLLAAAVVLLSVQPRFAYLRCDQVYDEIVKHRNALRPSITPESAAEPTRLPD